MKRIMLLVSMFIFTNLSAQEEEAKFRTFFDFGYFDSSFKPASDGGSYLSAGFGYKINEEFWLNLNIVKISATGEFEKSPLFINNNTTYTNTMFVPNFSKDWRIADKWYLSGILGGTFIFEKALLPTIMADNSNNIEGIEFSNQGDEFNIGLFGELAVKYELKKNFFAYFSVKSYLPMYLELESYMLGAGIEVRL